MIQHSFECEVLTPMFLGGKTLIASTVMRRETLP